MIRHILLIEFKASATPSQINALKDSFESIPEKISAVHSVEWGINNSPEQKNKHFTHAVVMNFTDSAAREQYLPHPEHKALQLLFEPILEDIIVFDYSV